MRARVNGTNIDLNEGTAPAFSYRLFDPMDPGSVTGSTSTKMKVPATEWAREHFGSHQTSEQLPSEIANIQFLEGTAILHQGTVVPTNWSSEAIEVVSVGDSASWMTQAKAKRLGDFDLGTFELEYNNVSGTWTENIIPFFPPIDYGLFQNRAVNYDVPLETLWPGIRVMPMLQKAFTSFGWSLKFDGRALTEVGKLIMPFTGNGVQATQSQLDANVMSAYLSAPNSPMFSGAWKEAVIPFDTAYNDPGSQFTANGYVANFTGLCSLTGQLSLRVQPSNTMTPGSQFSVHIYYKILSSYYGGLTKIVTSNGGTMDVLIDIDLNEMPMVAGATSFIAVRVSSSYGVAPTVFEVLSSDVTFTPTSINYQPGIIFDYNSTLPKMSVAELFSSCCKLGMVVDTDVHNRSIVVRYIDDHFLPTTQGEDLTSIQHISRETASSREPSPRYFNFRWKVDSNDMGTDQWTRTTPYGSEEFDMGEPRSGDKTIELPFAPTYMGFRFDGMIYMPVIIDKGNEGNTEFKTSTTPRLLFYAGMRSGIWQYDTKDLEEFPYCYFVPLANGDPSLAFGSETQGGPIVPGVVTRNYTQHLNRIKNGRMFTTRVAFDDVDIMGRNFRTPKLLSDGVGKGWYLLTEIKNYIWGGKKLTVINTMQA